MRRRLAAGLLCAALFSGCRSLEHLTYEEGHLWHTVPAGIGGGVVFLGTLPLTIVVSMVRGDLVVPDPYTSITWGYWAGAVVVGGPFYLLGLPFESGGPTEGESRESDDDVFEQDGSDVVPARVIEEREALRRELER